MRLSTIISLLLVLSFVILVLAGPVFVQANGGGKIIVIENPLKYDKLEDIIKAITGLLKTIAIFIGFLMVIISGIQIMTAGGSEEQVKKGKKTLMWTIIGVAIVVGVDFIVGIVKEILAVK